MKALQKDLLQNSSVSILRAKDSILVITGRTTANGKFTFKNLELDTYIMLVAYPGYVDFIEKFDFKPLQPITIIPMIELMEVAKVLNEVVIIGNANIVKFNKDTIEYDAKRLKMEPNAKVEDLLKRLPVMRISRDGVITANGKRVDKVLVDV